MNALQMIPAVWRDRIYGGFVLVGILLGALQVAFASIPDTGQPQWLTIALVVYAYLGTATGLMAKANTPAPAGGAPPGNQVGSTTALNLLSILVLTLVLLALAAWLIRLISPY